MEKSHREMCVHSFINENARFSSMLHSVPTVESINEWIMWNSVGKQQQEIQTVYMQFSLYISINILSGLWSASDHKVDIVTDWLSKMVDWENWLDFVKTQLASFYAFNGVNSWKTKPLTKSSRATLLLWLICRQCLIRITRMHESTSIHCFAKAPSMR